MDTALVKIHLSLTVTELSACLPPRPTAVKRYCLIAFQLLTKSARVPRKWKCTPHTRLPLPSSVTQRSPNRENEQISSPLGFLAPLEISEDLQSGCVLAAVGRAGQQCCRPSALPTQPLPSCKSPVRPPSQLCSRLLERRLLPPPVVTSTTRFLQPCPARDVRASISDVPHRLPPSC